MRFALAILLAAFAQPAHASWTFCVAESDGGKQIWITGVFPAARDRELLEADFKMLLRTRGVGGAVVQCPAPQDDKIDAINSQFTAAEFHRKLGDVLHSVTAPGFDPRR
jgi:hypothetical protein